MANDLQSAGRSVLRERDFRVLLFSYGVSAIGDYFAIVALTIKVHDVSGSGFGVAALMLSTVLPFVLLAPLVGLVIDRIETVTVLLITSAAQAVLAVGLAFADGLPAILLLSFLLSSGDALTKAGRSSLVPSVVGLPRATAGNAYLQTAVSLGGTAGPILGGLASAAFGTRLALLANAATFLMVTAGAAALRTRRRPQANQGEQPRAQEARAGVAAVVIDRVLRLAVGVTVVTVLLVSTLNVTTIFYVKDVLEAGDAQYGLLLATWAMGVVLGASVIARRIESTKLAPALLIASLVNGAALVPLALLPSIAISLPAFLVGGLAFGVVKVALVSLIQHRVSQAVLGRALAASTGALTAAQLAATGLGGILIGTVGAQPAMLIAGVGTTAAAAFGLVRLSVLVSHGQIGSEVRP